jgi:hypothetical protein
MLKEKGKWHFGEFLDLRSLVRKSGREEVYLCPYCVELTKSADVAGHFYYNPTKCVGHCFRCETVIISDALRTPELIRQQLETVPDEDRYPFQRLSIGDWTSPIRENNDCYDYMVKKRGIYAETLLRYNILATGTPRLGVVFCNKIWTDGLSRVTDFLSIRNVNSTLRHTNVRDQVKPLVWCNHVDTNRVILVEGTISGLSVYQHLDGTVCPLVLLGKTISSFQLSQLKGIVLSKKVDRVYVATDGGSFESGIKIARLVYKALDRQDVFLLRLPWKQDPNSISRKRFKELWENEIYPFQPLATNLLRQNAYGVKRR